MKKTILFGLILLLQFSCTTKDKPETNSEKSEVNSISLTDTKLGKSIQEQEDIKQEIIALTRKKDSLLNVLKSTSESMSRINDSKIDKGIEGVNLKLNQLKGQKENFDEQIALQKKETDLANKKIELLRQEKQVYDSQRKALYDRGAAPKDFVQVDSLLNGLTAKISEQNRRVKTLNRLVADEEEQMIAINDQRTFLSKKIRENYDAQEIFGEFAKEENTKITAQIKEIDLKISALTGNVNNINSTIASLNETNTVEKNEKKMLADEEIASAKTSNRLMIALIAIGILVVLFIALNYIGKKKNNKKNI